MADAAPLPRRKASPLPLVLAAAAALAAGAMLLGANWEAWFGPDPKEKAGFTDLRAGAKAGAPDPFAKYAQGKAGDPAAAAKLIDGYVEGARADNDAYIDALSAAGYIRAIGGEALAGGEIAQALDRVRRGQALAVEHRAKSLERIDRLEAAVRALPAAGPDAAALKEEMAAEVAALRESRIEYWEALSEVSDEVEELAKILTRAQGRWTVDLASREVLFQDAADDEDYAFHEDRSRMHRGQFEAASARVTRSAEALKTMAARWGS